MSKMKKMITLALVALGITAFASIAQAENVAKIGDTYYATLSEAVAAAETGDTVEIIKRKTYTLPASIANNIAITGAVKDVVIDATGTGSISSIPNGATFKNLEFTFGNEYYHGFYHAGQITMEHCSLKGLLFSYGPMTFKNSYFWQDTEEYCMWVYGGDEVTYDGCTFDVQGKCLNVFRENDYLVKLNVTNCIFNSTVLDKSAVNFKESSTDGKGVVTVLNTDGILSDCTIGTPEFFPTDKVGGSQLYMIDDIVSTNGVKGGVKVACDGEPVWPLVAEVNGTKYASLQAAVAAAKVGETVEIIMPGSYTLPKSIPLDIAITGAVENVKIDATGTLPSIPNGATFKNLAFTFPNNEAYRGFIHAGLITMEDCKISGFFMSYGSMTFKNSTFVQDTEEYCMWVYGGDEVTYDGCTFNVKGKCLNVYREHDFSVKLNVTNCTFNSTVLNKSAINFKETSTSGEKVTVLNTEGILSDCKIGTPDFFPTDKVGGSRLYMIDDLIPASEHKNTGLMITCDGKPVWPLPIEAKPVAVANATAEVYTNGYLSAKVSAHGWAAWSNQTATVVYTAAKGYLFADGSTVATNKLDTAVDPAVNAKGEVVPVAGKPAIELGVIAQRYPWDGKVDAHYRAKNWPKEGAFGAVEIKVGDTVVTNALNIFKSGEGVQVIDMKALFGEKAEKAQFKAIVSTQPTE